ncbi:hypothetical protein DOTSEDRAFT_67481 [Dothistroma septosporum NZE10]|uniref:Uncharacterized protein n=1 Tax=Dothistroma septosporum (strain NZE10 / CBS 128990) TaxID=675120 RepID=N1Q1S5_DOTSN|nr:hypothetical protein DOTSEDRAFT_67481 [Dothistroma septosporum NZE10]
MPPRTHASSLSSWRCPQCTIRSFATTTRQLAVGPEHPRYIEVPEPPQQNVPYKPPVKGVLPVPRDVFAGTDKSRSDEEAIAASTKKPLKQKVYAKGSREEWMAKMSEVRKQNLREGITSLRFRQRNESRRMRERSLANQAAREAALHRPEREDERLTAPSTNLDLEALFGKQVPDPAREQRIATKRENVARHEEAKRVERLDAIHTLYMNARDFIVTPQQLDKAVDEAFGTEQNPVVFGVSQYYSNDPAGRSIWAEGRPERVQDMLNRANGLKPRTAMDSAGGSGDINKDRIRRIAEMFTGGKMESTESR